MALQLRMNGREFARAYGEHNAVLEESWRRTRYVLYFFDQESAIVSRTIALTLLDVPNSVDLTCDDGVYESERVANTAASNFARLSAFAASIDAKIAAWYALLPTSKKDPLRMDGTIDEVMWSALTQAAMCNFSLISPWPNLTFQRNLLQNPSWFWHPSTQLVSHWATGLDRNRFKADSAFKYSLYFELLKRKIEQYDVDSRHIYNMDKKGFLIGVLSKMKRIFSKAAYEQGKLKHIVQDGNREWITTIAYICANGTALTPALIYQAQSGDIQDTWLQDFKAESHCAFFTSSPSG
ncbi:hypothetical protein EK21DRAFT_95187 [Setomelanomma holmii]|uniref:Uncharacterized protein n=1 Tax=Setomelanomma holmii TaxID=210430 RepID=A0A9P4GWQ6_9PLEO|nr:hypothetical protein EK21DRAFT_95187 [Setomelanomma holmii]